jgi:hypothetical protein
MGVFACRSATVPNRHVACKPAKVSNQVTKSKPGYSKNELWFISNFVSALTDLVSPDIAQ